MIRRCNPQFCQTKRPFPLEACLNDGSQRSRHGPCSTGQTIVAQASESYCSHLRSQRPQVKWSSVLDAKHRDGIQTETNLKSMGGTVFISMLNFSSAPSGRGAVTHPTLPLAEAHRLRQFNEEINRICIVHPKHVQDAQRGLHLLSRHWRRERSC